MISRKIWPYFILIIGFFATFTSAQRFPFRIYNVREGLPQSQVQSIIQDQQGYLWIGTRDGLAVFDGRQFKQFTTKDSLESNYVLTSYYDSHQNIWLAYRTRGLSKLNTKNRKIIPIDVSPELRNLQIDDILEDTYGRFWFATEGGGLFCLDSSVWNKYTKDDGLISNNINCLALKNDSELWIGTAEGVNILNINDQLASGKQDVKTLKKLNTFQVSDILIDKDKNAWIGTDNAGMYLVSDDQQSIKKYSVLNGLNSNEVKDIFQDSKQRIWIGSRAGGAALLSNPESEQFLHLTEKHGLAFRDVKCIFEDREGSIWIGTNGGGLCQFRDRRFEFFGLPEGLPDKTVWAIIEDRQGQFWFGTELGLVRYRPNPSKDELDIKTFSVQQGLADPEVSSLYEEKTGRRISLLSIICLT